MDPTESQPVSKNRKIFLALAGLVFVLLAIPLTVILVQRSDEASKTETQAAGRDPALWPFDKYSPWNMPIGSKATYVDGQINMSGKFMDIENELVFLDDSAPLRTLYAGDGGGEQWWDYPGGGGGPSCNTGLTNRGQVYVQDGYIVPEPPSGGDGTLPNRAGGALKSDGRTIQEFQYATRCSGTGPVTAGAFRTTYDIYGSGIPGGFGAHGGSGLSGVGGALRVWEVNDSGPIRHALKMTVNVGVLSKCSNGYRWPAIVADSGFNVSGGDNEYFGPVCDLRMGSLTAIHKDVNCQTFAVSALGKRLCQALQDYGAYIVDTGPRHWGAMAILGEYGTNNALFTAEDDIVKLFDNLHVISNNTSSTPGGCSLTDTTCTRRVAYAPDFGTEGDTQAPSTFLTSPTSNQTFATTAINLSATASDDSGTVAKVEFYIDGGKVGEDLSSPYTLATTTTAGSHNAYARAYDPTGNIGQSATVSFIVSVPDSTTDTDVDGYTDLREIFVKTKTDQTCGINAWPPDFTGDNVVNSGDQLLLSKLVGSTLGQSTYNPRFDLNADNAINSSDQLLMATKVGQRCKDSITGWVQTDIGSVVVSGLSKLSGSTYTLKGSGVDIWNNSDSFHYLYSSRTNDIVITAKVTSQTNTDPWAKAGLMFRESNDPGSKNVFLSVTPGNGIAFTYRNTANASSQYINPNATCTFPNCWLRLQRVGNTYTAFRSTNGTSWTQIASTTFTMKYVSLPVALAVTSHNNTTASTATFSDVKIEPK